jgi:hypothetical protein
MTTLTEIGTSQAGTRDWLRVSENLPVTAYTEPGAASLDKIAMMDFTAALSDVIRRQLSWQTSAIADIFAAEALPESPRENWRARRPSKQAFECATSLIRSISRIDLPKPKIVPGVDGSVQLAFLCEKRELEIDIESNGVWQFLQIENDKPGKEGKGNFKGFRDLLEWLVVS